MFTKNAKPIFYFLFFEKYNKRGRRNEDRAGTKQKYDNDTWQGISSIERSALLEEKVDFKKQFTYYTTHDEMILSIIKEVVKKKYVVSLTVPELTPPSPCCATAIGQDLCPFLFFFVHSQGNTGRRHEPCRSHLFKVTVVLEVKRKKTAGTPGRGETKRAKNEEEDKLARHVTKNSHLHIGLLFLVSDCKPASQATVDQRPTPRTGTCCKNNTRRRRGYLGRVLSLFVGTCLSNCTKIDYAAAGSVPGQRTRVGIGI